MTTTLVTAARYNNLRSRLRTVMGDSQFSNPQFGYGQTTTAATVVGNYNTNPTTANKIEDEQYRDIYIDLVRARVHQIGSAAFTQQPFPVGNFNLNGASTDKVRETYIAGLESLMTTIETDKFSIFDSTQGVLEPLRNTAGFTIQGSRTQFGNGAWNRTLSFIFTVNFASEQARRQFFNAGGQIRISANQTGAQPNLKTQNWVALLAAVGQVSFAANRTYSTLSYGSGSSIGNYNLTGSYQLIYRGYSSAYFSNAVEVYALQNSGTQIQFRVYLADQRSEGTDESVFGDFFVNANVLRPDGTVSISGTTYTTVQIATAPTGSVVTNLIQI